MFGNNVMFKNEKEMCGTLKINKNKKYVNNI